MFECHDQIDIWTRRIYEIRIKQKLHTLCVDGKAIKNDKRVINLELTTIICANTLDRGYP